MHTPLPKNGGSGGGWPFLLTSSTSASGSGSHRASHPGLGGSRPPCRQLWDLRLPRASIPVDRQTSATPGASEGTGLRKCPAAQGCRRGPADPARLTQPRASPRRACRAPSARLEATALPLRRELRPAFSSQRRPSTQEPNLSDCPDTPRLATICLIAFLNPAPTRRLRQAPETDKKAWVWAGWKGVPLCFVLFCCVVLCFRPHRAICAPGPARQRLPGLPCRGLGAGAPRWALGLRGAGGWGGRQGGTPCHRVAG